MRTNYPLDKIVRRKNDERRRLLLALVVIGAVALLVVFSQSVRLGLNKVTIVLTRPLWVIENHTLVLGGDLFNFFRSHKGLVEENRQLKEETFKLKVELATKELVAKDYERLAAIVGRTSGQAVPIVGRVILKPNRSPYDLILVDVGSGGARPVKVGDIARLNKDTTIGRVVNVASQTATVELFSSPGLETAVLVGADLVQATTTGRGGGNMLLELPRGLIINVGDSVVLPTSKAELVGLVGQVINEQSEPAQKILVSLPVNLFHLSWIEFYDH